MKAFIDGNGPMKLIRAAVLLAIGLLAAIAIPSFMKARTTSQKNACINNLRQMGAAKEQWALETKQAQGTTADTTACLVYLKATPVLPSRRGV